MPSRYSKKITKNRPIIYGCNPPRFFQIIERGSIHEWKEVKRIQLVNSAYIAWEKRLVTDPEIMAGETVFPNSRLTVRRIAALLEKGEPDVMILEDYPYLNHQDLIFAKIYYQKHSRVRPSGN